MVGCEECRGSGIIDKETCMSCAGLGFIEPTKNELIWAYATCVHIAVLAKEEIPSVLEFVETTIEEGLRASAPTLVNFLEEFYSSDMSYEIASKLTGSGLMGQN